MINKDDIYKIIDNKDDRVLISNILDKYYKYNKTGLTTYSNFLDIRKLKVVTSILNRYKISYNIYKVDDVCEKSIIYFGEEEDFVTIYQIKNNDFKHKDVLGTLFSLGLDVDTIGDIFVTDDYVYITNLTRLNTFLETSLYEINNKRVELSITDKMILPEDRFLSFKIIIPSYRLDVIVSKLAHTGRNESVKLIKDGMVLVNYEEVFSPSKIVQISDIISIRRVGKFIIDSLELVSKKDNYLVNIKKYN